MSIIKNFKENHKVDLQGARNHVKIVINNYSQLETLVFHKQLDVTLRGLVVAGINPKEAEELIRYELSSGGFNQYEWINGRTTSEVITGS